MFTFIFRVIMTLKQIVYGSLGGMIIGVLLIKALSELYILVLG